jgi:cytochrome c-type biogenesis protein CcmH
MTPGGLTLIGVMAIAVAAGTWYAFLLRRQRAHARCVRRATANTRDALQQLKERAASGAVSVEEYERERRRLVDALLKSTAEGQGSLFARPAVPVASAAVVAVALVGGYLLRDSLFAPRATRAGSAASAEVPRPSLSDDQLERTVAAAQEQTRRDPRDGAAWAMLAHSLDMLGKFAESSQAYARLVEIKPDDAQTWADYADALAVANGRRLAGKPTELIERALALDPHNAKALALAGTAAFQRESYREALDRWQRAETATADPKFRGELDASIRQARVALKEDVAAPVTGSTAAPRAATVSGRVMLADELMRTLPPDATVYVFARPVSGSRMPVAILKRRVKDLPMAFTLDDSMGMVPEAKLSRQTMVVVGARVSRDGDVMPKPGDAEGWSAPVPVGASGVKLEISEQLK